MRIFYKFFGLGVVLTVAGIFPSGLRAQQPPRYYLMTDIGSGRSLEARAATSSLNGYTMGNYFGGFGCSSSVTRNGFLLTDTWRLFPLCPLSGDTQSIASSFEIVGTPSAVGRSISASGLERPVQWNRRPDGTFSTTPVSLPLGSLQGVAYGTDDFGRLTGEIELGGLRVAAYWPSATTTPTPLPLSGASQGWKIRGNSTEALVTGTYGNRFFLWYPSRTGSGNLLFPLGSTPSSPRSLRWTSDPPVVVGSMTLPEGTRGFVWRGVPPVQSLGTLGGSVSEAWDILPGTNQIVGGATNAQESRRAVLWEGGKIYDLNQALLPTCRAGASILCAPTLLQNANWIAANGDIAGQALIGTDLHAFLLRPVGPFTWTLGACAGVGTPYCIALGNPVYSSSSPFSAPVYRSVATPAPARDTRSAVTTQAARALASTSSRNLQSEAQFQNYLIFENLSLANLLTNGNSTVRVNFHFKVKASIRRCSGNKQTATASANLLVRTARGAGYLAVGSGSIQFVGTGANQGFGIFSAHPNGGSFDVVLPVDLSPRSLGTDSLELRIEGTATAAAFAITGTGGCASADITAQFCASDPAAITLQDGTPLASRGVRYANWPTLSPTSGCVDVPL